MRKVNIFAVFLMICLLAFFWGGCSKKNKTQPRNNMAEQTQAPRTGLFEENNKQPQHPFAEGKTQPKMPNVDGFLKKTKNMEKYDSSDESCRKFCKIWCPKAARCKMNLMRKVSACKKLCYEPCTKGVIPKALAECFINTEQCSGIKDCFMDLKSQVPSGHPAAEEQEEKAVPEKKPEPSLEDFLSPPE